MKHCKLAWLSLALLPQLGSAQNAAPVSATQVIAAAAQAMGVDNLKTLGSFSYSGAGATYRFGDARTLNAAWPKETFTSYHRTINFDQSASLEVITRGEKSDTRRIPFVEPYGKHRNQYEIWIMPLAFLRRASESGATVETKTVAGKQYRVISFTFEKKYKISGYLNDANLLERIETHLDNPVLGDMLVEAAFSDYKDFGHGLIFPSKIVESAGGFPVFELAVSTAAKNTVELAAETMVYNVAGNNAGGGTDPVYHGPFLGKAPPVFVDEQRLDQGIYYFGFKDDSGDVFHTVVSEFDNYLVVIEAPLDEAHAQAVIEEIRSLFGNKPIRYVINTHAHFEAAGGLRTFAAEGAIILTQDANKPYLEKVLAQPRTLSPDRLSQVSKKVVIETVAERSVITDGTHMINLYHVTTGHSDGMLIAYLPKQKLVVEAGMYAARDEVMDVDNTGHISFLPKQTDTLNAADLINGLDRLKIDYQKIACLQGRMATKAELLADAKQSPSE